MKVIEQKEFETKLLEVRKSYLNINNEYTRYLKMSENNGECDISKTQSIIDKINMSLDIINSLREPLNRIKSIKIELERLNKEFQRKEEEFSKKASDFSRYWNCDDISDDERAEYSIQLGRLGSEYKDLVTNIRQINNIITFLEHELDEGRLIELNGMANYCNQILMTLKVIKMNSNSPIEEDGFNYDYSLPSDYFEEKKSVSDVINSLNSKLNLLEEEDSYERDDEFFEEMREKKKKLFIFSKISKI